MASYSAPSENYFNFDAIQYERRLFTCVDNSPSIQETPGLFSKTLYLIISETQQTFNERRQSVARDSLVLCPFLITMSSRAHLKLDVWCSKFGFWDRLAKLITRNAISNRWLENPSMWHNRRRERIWHALVDVCRASDSIIINSSLSNSIKVSEKPLWVSVLRSTNRQCSQLLPNNSNRQLQHTGCQVSTSSSLTTITTNRNSGWSTMKAFFSNQSLCTSLPSSRSSICSEIESPSTWNDHWLPGMLFLPCSLFLASSTSFPHFSKSSVIMDCCVRITLFGCKCSRILDTFKSINEVHKNPLSGYWMFLWVCSKVPEYVDTLFIVLRKKP